MSTVADLSIIIEEDLKNQLDDLNRLFEYLQQTEDLDADGQPLLSANVSGVLGESRGLKAFHQAEIDSEKEGPFRTT